MLELIGKTDSIKKDEADVAVNITLSIAKSRCGGLQFRGTMARGKSRARRPQTLASSAAALPAPPLKEFLEADTVPVDVLTEDTLRRLAPADLLRAALACHRWRRAAARALPSAPPHLGYFFHPADAPSPPPSSPTDKTYPAVFVPVDASRSRSPPAPPTGSSSPTFTSASSSSSRTRSPKVAPSHAARRASRRPLASRQASLRRRRALTRAPEQALLRRRPLHRPRRPPACPGRLSPRRRLHLARDAASRGCQGGLRPSLVRGPLRARRLARTLDTNSKTTALDVNSR
jgi:hypothetical protein